MAKSISVVEKNTSASFGYVKKDILMLNDSFSDLNDKFEKLLLEYTKVLDDFNKIKKEVNALKKKKK